MSLVFASESVASCWDEIMVLAKEHWTGTKTYRRHQPFCPSRERYQQCNEAGFFHLFTARDEGTLVGYFGVYVTPSMHSQLLLATEDTFYLTPAYRQGRTAIRFIKFIEEQCRAAGVVEIMFSCEQENPTKRLLEYLDYKPVIVQFSKYLQPVSCTDSAATNTTEDRADVCTEPAASTGL